MRRAETHVPRNAKGMRIFDCVRLCSLMFAYVRLCSLNGKKNIEGAAHGPARYIVSISLRTGRFSHPCRSFSRPGPNQEVVATGNGADFAIKPIPPCNLGYGVRTDY